MPAPAISQALTALLPSLPASNKPFPPALVSQCESLLALSRQRASNLKPEEEIARAHVCSEIACKRLRAQLRLPAIKNGAGAPCKPRVYTKLIGFLEGVLADAPIGSLTPKGRKRDASGTIRESDRGSAAVSSPRTIAERSQINLTPSKRRVMSKDAGATFTGKIRSGKAGAAHVVGQDKVPDFVMPAVRKLCKRFVTPQMVPHVYTGTCVLLELAGLWPLKQDQELNQDLQVEISALLVAVYLVVLTRMRKGKMTPPVYKNISEGALKSLEVGEEALEKVENWVSKLNSENWCNGQDWWNSVPEDVLVLRPHNEAMEESADEVGGGDIEDGIAMLGKRLRGREDTRKMDLDKDDPDGVLLSGLGTMLHDGTDWTSEDRKLDYREWKSILLRKIAAMERTKGKRVKAVTIS